MVVVSHQLKQFVIDGETVFLSFSNPKNRVNDYEFKENEVYAIDIVTSTGDGKPKLLDVKDTAIYRRASAHHNNRLTLNSFVIGPQSFHVVVHHSGRPVTYGSRSIPGCCVLQRNTCHRRFTFNIGVEMHVI